MINYKIYDQLSNSVLKNIIKNIYKDNKNFFFQSILFLNSCKKIYYENNNNLKIIIILKNEVPICVVPTYLEINKKIKILKWLSCEAIDYNVSLLNHEIVKANIKEVDKVLMDAFNEISPDLIFFDKIPEFIFQNKNNLLNNYFKKYTNSYYYNYQENIGDYYNKTTNSKTKQTDKRKLKKILLNGAISFEKIIINEKNNFLLNKLIDCKHNQYLEKKIKTFNKDKLYEFYKNLVVYSDKDFDLVLHKMKVSNTEASLIFGIEHRNFFYYLIPYVPKSDIQKFSPGRLHLKNILDTYQKKKISVDFTSGDEKYKSDWSNVNFNVNYILILKSIRGILFFLYYFLYFKLRKINFLKKLVQIINFKNND